MADDSASESAHAEELMDQSEDLPLVPIEDLDAPSVLSSVPIAPPLPSNLEESYEKTESHEGSGALSNGADGDISASADQPTTDSSGGTPSSKKKKSGSKRREKEKERTKRKSLKQLEKRISRKLEQGGSLKGPMKIYTNSFFADFEKISTSDDISADIFPDMLRFPDTDVTVYHEPRALSIILEDYVRPKKWPSAEKGSPHWLRECFALFAKKKWTLVKFNASAPDKSSSSTSSNPLIASTASTGSSSSLVAQTQDASSLADVKMTPSGKVKRGKKDKKNNSLRNELLGSYSSADEGDRATADEAGASAGSPTLSSAPSLTITRASVDGSDPDSGNNPPDSLLALKGRKISGSVSSEHIRTGSTPPSITSSPSISSMSTSSGNGKKKAKQRVSSVGGIHGRTSGEMPLSEVDRALASGFVPTADNIRLRPPQQQQAAGTEESSSSFVSELQDGEHFGAPRPARHLLKSCYRSGLFTHYNTMQKTLGIQEIMDFNRSRVHSPFEFLGTPKKTQFLVELRELFLPLSPLFCTVSLHDLSTRSKVTEDFHFELNDKQAMQLLDRDESAAAPVETRTCRALFTLTGDSTNSIYMLIRVHRLVVPEDKEKYLFQAPGSEKKKAKSDKDSKDAGAGDARFNSSYTQPYCWAAVPISVNPNQTMLSTYWASTQSPNPSEEKEDVDTGALMQISPVPATAAASFAGGSPTSSRNQCFNIGPFALAKTAPTTEDIYDLLVNEKEMRKLKTFPGQMVVSITKVGYASTVEEEMQKCQMDPSLVAVQPFDESLLETKPDKPIRLVRQIQEFGSCRDFLMQYVNNFYVHIKSAVFKQREKANIQVEIRLRDCDTPPRAAPNAAALGKSDALQAIYGRSFEQKWLRSQRTGIQLHDRKTGFIDEVKMTLPIQIGPEHHLLFIVYDIDIKKGKESVLGYAVLPLFLDGRPNLPLQVDSLPIYPELPEGYLLPNVQAKLRAVDVSKKSCLSITTRVVSSFYSQDPKLADFFFAYDPSPPPFANRAIIDEAKLTEIAAREKNYTSIISALQRAKPVALFRHFPVLLTMLLKIICATHQSDNVAREALLCMIHIIRTVSEHTSGKYSPFLRAYLACLFDHSFFGAGFFPPFEALVRCYNSLIHDRDPQIVNFDSHWFFFCLITKSMALHLHENKMLSNAPGEPPRQERFSESFIVSLQKLLRSLLCEHNVRGGLDYIMACSLFVKDLFSLIDRGVVMSIISEFLAATRGEFSSPMAETFKFAFLKILINYEHFIPLNLPVPLKLTKGVELSSLSQRLKEKHYLIGQLIEETRRHYSSTQGEDILRNQAIICLRSVLTKQETLYPFPDPVEAIPKSDTALMTYPLPNERDKLVLKRHARLAAMYLPFMIHVLDDPTVIISDTIMKTKEKEEWLICIIFFLRYASRKLITAWWQMETQKRQANLFLLLEHCVKVFDTGALSRQVDLVVAEFIATITEFCSNDLNEITSDLQASPLLKRIVAIFLALFKKIDEDSISFMQHYTSPMMLMIERCTKGLLHESSAEIIQTLVVEFMRQTNHSSKLISNFGATMLYLLLRRVRQETGSFTRMRTECLVGTSKMVGTSSLGSLVASLASMKLYAFENESPAFAQGVEDTVNASLTMLDLRSRIERHKNDPEMMQELYYNITKSYLSNPELRVTWLDNLANANIATEDYEEAAQCKMLIANLIARYLSRPHSKASSSASAVAPGRKLTALGKDFVNFSAICPNAYLEAGLEEAPTFESDNWNLKYLIFNLKEAVSLFAKATRWELCLEIYNVLVQIHKSQKKYGDIIPVLKDNKDMCERLVDVNNPIERLYPVYFRVAFYGTKWEEQNGKEYVYKRTAKWNLSTFKKKLEDQYKDKFEPGELVILSSNDPINPAKLDATKSYIQMTGIQPYFEADEMDDRVTKPEQNFRINQFLFEMPITDNADGGTSTQITDDLSRQRKKKTIFVTTHMFPYIRNRLEIVSKREILLSPIENAIELLKLQVAKLRQELESFPTRVKSLQQVIQGSVVPMVNPGPSKIIEIFLSPGVFREKKYEAKGLLELMDAMDKFSKMCGFAIKLNKSLIDETQVKFQQMVEKFYGELSERVRVCLETLRQEHKATQQQ